MPHTLLLADDSVTIQRVIELTFADEDVTVVAVSDGDQAIARLEAAPPDIVLADIGMPGKNGYEVAQFIRRSPKLAHIPVLLLTGAFEPVDQARANEAGCDGVLAKPFEPQMVIGRVKELLARGHRAADQPNAALGQGAEDGDFALPPLPPRTTPAADSIWAPAVTQQPRNTPFVEPPAAGAQTGPVPRAELNDYFDRLDAAFSSLGSAPAPVPAPPVPEPPAAPLDSSMDWFTKPSETTPADLPLAYEPPRPETSPFDLLEPPAAPPVDWSAPAAAPDERLAPIEESAPVEPMIMAVETGPVFAPEPVASAEPIAQHAPPSWAAPIEPSSWPETGAAAEPASWAAPAASVEPAAWAEAPAGAAAPAAPALVLPLPNPPPLPSLPDAFAALLAAEQGDPMAAASGSWPASPPPAASVSDAVIDDIVRRVLDRLSDTLVRQAVTDAASETAERLVREEIERIKASIK